MAILVLKNADFSANYIKKIEIFNGFSETTKAVFTRCGITEDESNLMQISVDTFINRLVTAGLWGTKIKSLCIPFLSEMGANGNLAKAQLNIIDGTNFFTTDISGSLALSSHGLTPVSGASTKGIKITDYISSVEDFHLAFYNTTSEPTETVVTGGGTAEVCLKAVIRPYFIFGLCKQRNVSGVARPTFYLSQSTSIYGDLNYANASCLQIGTIKSGVATLAVNGQFNTLNNYTLAADTVSTATFGRYRGSTYTDGSQSLDYSIKASYGLLSLGTGLSQDEMSAYTTAVNDLMEAMSNYLA